MGAGRRLPVAPGDWPAAPPGRVAQVSAGGWSGASLYSGGLHSRVRTVNVMMTGGCRLGGTLEAQEKESPSDCVCVRLFLDSQAIAKPEVWGELPGSGLYVNACFYQHLSERRKEIRLKLKKKETNIWH